ncbi:hypothetical protein [Ramlibacter sp.]|uniref:hypothetical protein n=1 Tax=Ramlibacter sp. TaxID=1917967 RepID=UPI0017D150D9|nr:hypothetical protein [Ramlibacter sp.]MBA2672137.1 hypothetical protein [Ramlibacter sp.]
MIVVKTEAGQQVMKDRSVALTPRQRSALILVDGKRSRDQLLTATAAAGATPDDVDTLFALGLISEAEGTPAMSVAHATVVEPEAPRSDRTPQERYSAAYPIATQLTAGLGLRGFRLNLAVESASGYQQLAELAPKIRDAVGPDLFAPLDKALHG